MARGTVTNRGTNKKRRKRLRTAFVVLAAVALCILLLISPLFAVRKVDVAPLTRYDSDAVTALVQEVIGRNGFLAVADNTSFSQSKSIFSMEMPLLEEKLLFELPYLEQVMVKYSFPNTLIVTAKERTSAFLAEHYGIYLLVDTHGVLLGTFTQEDKPNMPIVTGLEIDDYKIGMSLTDGKNSAIDSAIKICGMMTQLSMQEYIDIIDITDYNNIRLYCAPSLEILFGTSDDVGTKLTKLKGILDDSLSGDSDGILNMMGGNNPTFIKNDKIDKGNAGDDSNTDDTDIVDNADNADNTDNTDNADDTDIVDNADNADNVDNTEGDVD